MNLRSTPPWRKASLERDSATEATSGKIERTRMSRTVGQMNNHLAAPSERQASSVSAARRVARPRSADPPGTGFSGFSSSELSLDAKAGDVSSELAVLSGLVRDGVPTIRDGPLGPGGVELSGEVLGE